MQRITVWEGSMADRLRDEAGSEEITATFAGYGCEFCVGCNGGVVGRAPALVGIEESGTRLPDAGRGDAEPVWWRGTAVETCQRDGICTGGFGLCIR